MTVYKSKIGYAILIPILLLVGGTAVLMAFNNLWLMFFFILLVLAFIGYSLLTISYMITGTTLKVKYSLFFETVIDIASIKSVKETNNPLSSPAASLDRLEIIYKNGSILISPKDKSGFINHLLAINLSIEVKLKSNSLVKLSR